MKKSTLFIFLILFGSCPLLLAQSSAWNDFQSVNTMTGTGSAYASQGVQPVGAVGAYSTTYTSDDVLGGSSSSKGPVRRGFGGDVVTEDPDQSEESPVGEPWVLLLMAGVMALFIGLRKNNNTMKHIFVKIRRSLLVLLAVMGVSVSANATTNHGIFSLDLYYGGEWHNGVALFVPAGINPEDARTPQRKNAVINPETYAEVTYNINLKCTDVYFRVWSDAVSFRHAGSTQCANNNQYTLSTSNSSAQSYFRAMYPGNYTFKLDYSTPTAPKITIVFATGSIPSYAGKTISITPQTTSNLLGTGTSADPYRFYQTKFDTYKGFNFAISGLDGNTKTNVVYTIAGTTTTLGEVSSINTTFTLPSNTVAKHEVATSVYAKLGECGTGTPATKSIWYQVYANLVPYCNISSSTGRVGGSVTLSAGISSGTVLSGGNYTYQYYNGSSWQNIGSATTSTSQSWTLPSTAATYRVRVQYTDLGTTFTSAEKTVTVSPNPTVSISNPTANIRVNNSVSLTATVQNKLTEGTFKFYQSVNGGGFVEKQSGTGNTYAPTLTTAGSYKFKVTYTENGYTATSSESTACVVWNNPTVDLAVSATDIQVGNSITLTATAHDVITSGTYTFYQSTDGGSSWSQLTSGTTNTYQTTPAAIGTYTYKVQYSEGGFTPESTTQSAIVWDNYTIHIRDGAKRTNHIYVYRDESHKTANWPGEAISPDVTGGDWFTYELKYPLYTSIMVNNGNSGNGNQSEACVFHSGWLPQNNAWLKVQYKSDSQWPWSSTTEPAKPAVTFEVLAVYSVKLKVKATVNNNNSTFSEAKFVYNGTTYNFELNTDGVQEQEVLLESLDPETAYNFTVTATNSLGTATIAQSVTTNPRRPVTVKVCKDHDMYWGAMSYYCWSTAADGKLFDDKEYINLSLWKDENNKHWYTFEVPDLPATLYFFNGYNRKDNGNDYSQTMNIDLTGDLCIEVINDHWWVEADNYHYRQTRTYDYCDNQYKLWWRPNGDVNEEGQLFSNNIETSDEIMSLYLQNKGILKLQKFNAGGSWQSWSDCQVVTMPSDIVTSDGGVYTVTISDLDNVATATKSFAPYTGDYYIRSSIAPGQWDNYLNPGNVMTQFTPDAGVNYSNYWISEAKSGAYVHARVGNIYNKDITPEYNSDDVNCTSKQMVVDAAVRYGYNPTTNTITRSYMADPSNDTYLVIQGDQLGGATKFQPVGNYEYYLEGTAQSVSGSDAKIWCHSAINGGNIDRKGTEANKYTVLSGNATRAYTMRYQYDFKTDRFMAAWVPDGQPITDNLSTAEIMTVRHQNNDAEQVVVAGGGQLTYTNKAYAVMEFDRDELGANTIYWVSFPFDVNMSEVYGNVGKYDEAWIMQYYDGKSRAEQGGWAENTFWKFVDANATLTACEGYTLCLDPTYMQWQEMGGKQICRLYFPSASGSYTINSNNKQQVYSSSEYECKINRPTTDGDRRVKDSHWHIFGAPVYANIASAAMGEGGTLPGYYAYDKSAAGSKYTVVPYSENYTNMFKYMYGYFSHINGTFTFTPKTTVPSSIAARKADEKKNYDIELNLLQGETNQDKTYIFLREEAETIYDRFDLGKMMSTGISQIYTTSDGKMGINSLPVESQLVGVEVKTVKAGEYTFSMSTQPDCEVKLIDKETKMTTDLSKESYTVTLAKGTISDRFELEITVKGTPTIIEQMFNQMEKTNSETVKMIYQGQMYIIRNGVMYNAMGAIIK